MNVCLIDKEYGGKFPKRLICSHTWRKLFEQKEGRFTYSKWECIDCKRQEYLFLIRLFD